MLPSSQVSPLTFVPSPQTPVHMLGAPEHMNPDSTTQRCEHPSPSVRLPSSQPSPASSAPSPQVLGATQSESRLTFSVPVSIEKLSNTLSFHVPFDGVLSRGAKAASGLKQPLNGAMPA